MKQDSKEQKLACWQVNGDAYFHIVDALKVMFMIEDYRYEIIIQNWFGFKFIRIAKTGYIYNHKSLLFCRSSHKKSSLFLISTNLLL